MKTSAFPKASTGYHGSFVVEWFEAGPKDPGILFSGQKTLLFFHRGS